MRSKIFYEFNSFCDRLMFTNKTAGNEEQCEQRTQMRFIYFIMVQCRVS